MNNRNKPQEQDPGDDLAQLFEEQEQVIFTMQLDIAAVSRYAL